MFKRLFDIREENDLTQDGIAEILKVSHVAISLWETGKEVIPLNKLNEFANHFDVSFDYLANFTNDRQYNKVTKGLDSKLIGERLTQIRKDNNISQRALSDLLNTSSSTISAYETGKVLILTIFAYEIAKRYSVSLDWICGKIK